MTFIKGEVSPGRPFETWPRISKIVIFFIFFNKGCQEKASVRYECSNSKGYISKSGRYKEKCGDRQIDGSSCYFMCSKGWNSAKKQLAKKRAENPKFLNLSAAGAKVNKHVRRGPCVMRDE